MIVRNIKEYRDALIPGKEITCLGDKAGDPLLTDFTKSTFSDYLRDLYDFATIPTYQVFFEMLQNADDEDATHVYIYFTNQGFLVINNGAPFETNFGKDRQLRSFLTKGQGGKSDDSSKTGEKSRGSKLLYDLFLDEYNSEFKDNRSTKERIYEKLIEKQEGLFLFSWSDLSQLEKLRTGTSPPEFTGNFQDTSIPLLTKILFSYYPAFLNEEKYTVAGENRCLFSDEELDRLRAFLKQAFPTDTSLLTFQRGALLFLPLGKGKENILASKVEESVGKEIPNSFPFLKSLQQVQINGNIYNRSTRKEYKEVHSILFIYANFRLLLPHKKTSNYVNFYINFPISQTNLGLKFLINSREFEVDGGRQRLDIDVAKNKGTLETISEVICQWIREAELTELRNFLVALIHTNKDGEVHRQSFYKEHYYEHFRIALQQRIPTANGMFASREKVKFLHSELEVRPKDLGIDGIHWLDQELSDYRELITAFLEIETWKINDLLKAADREKTNQWVSNLTSKSYSLFLKEVDGLALEEAMLKEMPLFRFPNNKVYSWSEIEASPNLIWLDDRVTELSNVLDHYKTISYSSEHRCFPPGMLGEFKEWNTPAFLYDRIEPVLGSKDLSRYDKWSIWSILKDQLSLSNEFLRNQLLLFSDQGGTQRALAELVKEPEDTFPSGLLKHRKLSPQEYQASLKPFLNQKEEHWQLVLDSWPAIEQTISAAPNTYAQFIGDLRSCYNNSKEKVQLEDDVNWIVNSHGELINTAECFLPALPKGFSAEQYSSLVDIIERVSDLQLPGYSILSALHDTPFSSLTIGNWPLLRESWSGENHQINEEEIRLLKGLSDALFDFFILSQDSRGIHIRLKEKKEYQYYTEDEWVQTALQDSDTFFLLPSSLLPILSGDTSLVLKTNGLPNRLVEKHGKDHKFVRLVAQSNDPTLIKKYLHGIPTIELNSKDERESLSQEVEGELIKLLNRAIQETTIGLVRDVALSKIQLDGIRIKDYTYSPTITVSDKEREFVREFPLAKIIPSLADKTEAMDRIKSKLRGVLGNLFQTEQYKPEKAYQFVQYLTALDSPEQIAFAVAQAYAKDWASGPHFSPELIASINEQERLNAFYQYDLKNLDKYKVLGEVVLKALVPIGFPSYLRLEKEVCPDWILAFLNEKPEDKEKRLAFLESNGLPGRNSAIAETRWRLEKQEYCTKDTIEEANHYFPELLRNTLQWYAQKEVLLAPDSDRARTLRYIIETLGGISKAAYCLVYQSDFSKLKLIRLNTEEVFAAYEGRIRLDEQLVWMEVGTLLARKLLWERQAISGKDNIPIIKLNSEYDETSDYDPEEWIALFYQNWKEKVDTNFQIFTSEQKISLAYSYQVGNGVWQSIGTSDQRQCYRREITNDSETSVQLYVHIDGEESVLERLFENREELFQPGEADYLTQLQAFALRQAQLPAGGSSNALPEGPTGEALTGPTISGATDQEVEKIQDNLTSVNKILSQLTKEDLEALAKDPSLLKDIADQENDQATPNQIIGYIGECLIYHYLHKIQRGRNIQWTAIGQDPTPYYDITLDFNGKLFQVDVKTTIKPIQDLNESAAFYIKRSQLNHMKNEQPENYWIVRISLKDLGLDGLYSQELKHLTSVYSKEEIIEKNRMLIEERIKEFLSIEDNISLIKRKQLAFKVARPGKTEQTPFE
ncbi:DUF3883 domain-containing protein [Lewinella cohaerens]|uniref:DUF3883 domain-containing protein n=1 Tax=Lewinella cohaerens TaxID=70995 RepID=UPI0003824415|nr:DUF3883 domain-containing protein [Lewinella cohaerens]